VFVLGRPLIDWSGDDESSRLIHRSARSRIRKKGGGKIERRQRIKQKVRAIAVCETGQPIAGLGQIERLMFRGQDEQLRTGTQRSAAR
jgi:hypothetical protein